MKGAVRAVSLLVLVGLASLDLSGAASARTPTGRGHAARSVPGSAQWCKHHPKSRRRACQPAVAPPSPVAVTVSPDPIVETGSSDVYAVFSVATEPVYAEQTEEIFSGVNDRCGQGVTWMTDEGSFTGATASATIDDDGNATFTLLGASCAAGSFPVTVEVEAGTDPTFTTTVTIDPPAPTL